LGKLLRKRVISSKDLIMLWESKPPRRKSEATSSSIDALLRVALEHAKRSSKAEASENKKPPAEKPEPFNILDLFAPRKKPSKTSSEPRALRRACCETGV